MAILELNDIHSSYGEVQILWGATMALDENKLTALVGGNGVGKTTLLRTVMGTIKPVKGTIKFQGKDISNLPPYTKAEMGLVLVPERNQIQRFTEPDGYLNNRYV